MWRSSYSSYKTIYIIKSTHRPSPPPYIVVYKVVVVL